MSDRRIHPQHDHDDGLVHSHDWARSANAAPAACHPAPAPALERRRFHHTTRPEIDHDDGLVHDHAWARSERMSGYAAE